MVVVQGAEWSFAYVLPQKVDQPICLIVPNVLQMGWKDSPGYFCLASETARDMEADMAGFNGCMANLPCHQLESEIKVPDAAKVPPMAPREDFQPP